MKIKQTQIDKVIPYARNPRRNGEAIAKVAASLKEFGWQQPIVVDNEMVVVAGHTRLAAARTLGMDAVPVVIADNLTSAQVKAYRLADNRVGEEATWDRDLLALEIDELQLQKYDLNVLGFDEDELNIAEIDYSVLDDDSDIDGELDDMEGNVKKAIQIEFEAEHYEEAAELVKYWRDRDAYVGFMILDFLRNQKNKA